MHSIAVHALEKLLAGDELLCVAIQNIAEFWNAVTRPTSHNGLGFTIEKAQEEINRLEGFFHILSENAISYATWKTLLIKKRVSGVQVHDARLVAVMITYGVTKIVTFNVQDFIRFSEVEAIHPEKVV